MVIKKDVKRETWVMALAALKIILGQIMNKVKIGGVNIMNRENFLSHLVVVKGIVSPSLLLFEFSYFIVVK